MSNIFEILKKMFGGTDEVSNTPKKEMSSDNIAANSTQSDTKTPSYIPNPNDIQIVVGDDVLIVTDNRCIGGLWAGVDNYDPCSGNVQECHNEMKKIINKNFDEACENLIFKLETNSYLINIADCENRGRYNYMGQFYADLFEEKYDLFSPVITHFIQERSQDKNIGIICLLGYGTSIGVNYVYRKLKAEGLRCFIEVTTLPIHRDRVNSMPEKCKEYVQSKDYEKFNDESFWRNSNINIMEFWRNSNINIMEFFDKEVPLLLKAMKERVRERISSLNNMKTLFDIQRFVQAQENCNTYETALQEVKESYKRTHWIWYIFPQIDGLGHSSTSKRYGIKSLLEAKAYLENDYLRNHLYEITKALIDQDESLLDVLGRIDAIKVCSCMTLFNLVSHDDVFARVLEKYNKGMECEGTLEIVKKELTYYNEDSAFERNGIHTQEKAFFESGSDESNQYSFEQEMATMLDLVSRGETMLAMVQRYFWERDMSHYRVSGVEFTILHYLRSLINELSKTLKDQTLAKEVYDFLHAIPFSESNVFTWANAYDEFYKKYHQNNEIKAAFETILKDSLCKPIEKKPMTREYNGVERPEYTPSKLSSLKNDEVFVFGSNLAGRHAGGAARAAVNR